MVRLTRRQRRPRTRGQALVEFALVIPIFLIVALGLVEFAFVFNAVLATNFASRTAALLAAEAGDGVGSDCVILQSVEREMGAPVDKNRILQVDIYWADANGAQIANNVTTYTRGGTKTCNYPDGTSITVPYTNTIDNYPEASRCNVLAGCGGGHNGVDTIGVRITYSHQWKTPLNNFLSNGSGGYVFSRSNSMRMEPVL